MPNPTLQLSTPIPFSYETHPVRTVIIDGEVWFVAGDLAIVLEYGEAKDLVRVLDDDEKGRHSVPTPSGTQEMLIINESGMYHILFKSRKEIARKFRKWVTSEVLPAIRKMGKYETPTASTITPAQQRQLQEAIATRFPDGKQRPYAWSRFNNHFKLGSYKQLPADQVEEALGYIANIPTSHSAPSPLFDKPDYRQKVRSAALDYFDACRAAVKAAGAEMPAFPKFDESIVDGMIVDLLLGSRFILSLDHHMQFSMRQISMDSVVVSIKDKSSLTALMREGVPLAVLPEMMRAGFDRLAVAKY